MPDMALAALIDGAKRRNGWSDTDIAVRGSVLIEQPAKKLTKQDISTWRTHGMTTLVPAKVRALAHGIGMPAYKVALAALTDAGIDVPQDVSTPERAIQHDHTLSELTRAHLLGMLATERARPLPSPRRRDRRP